jgi:hypothetical protein
MPPLDAQPLAAPERAEGGQQDADTVLQGVLRLALQWRSHMAPTPMTSALAARAPRAAIRMPLG